MPRHDEQTRVRLTELRVGPRAEALVGEVLRSGQLAQGPMVARFETAFAEATAVAHAVAVSNGTVALVLALEALGVGPGDEVVTIPWTFAATLNAVLARGASVRLVDIAPDDYAIDVDAFAAAIGPATRAVLPVHLYGLPADMRAVETIASVHDVEIVEDAAQAHGATVDDRPVGGFGIGTFSFYATKNLTTGEGGMVTTDDEAIAERLRLLRNQGMRERYVYELPGHNARLTDLQAAIGVAEVTELADRTARRRANAARLDEGLGDVEGLIVPVEKPGRRHVFHQYTVRIRPEARLDRDTVHKELDAHGIESGIYYPRPLHAYPCYREHARVVTGWLPEAERAAREVLSLPVHPWLSESDLDRIVSTLRLLL